MVQLRIGYVVLLTLDYEESSGPMLLGQGTARLLLCQNFLTKKDSEFLVF